jgi:hypothetical protein
MSQRSSLLVTFEPVSAAVPASNSSVSAGMPSKSAVPSDWKTIPGGLAVLQPEPSLEHDVGSGRREDPGPRGRLQLALQRSAEQRVEATRAHVAAAVPWPS